VHCVQKKLFEQYANDILYCIKLIKYNTIAKKTASYRSFFIN